MRLYASLDRRIIITALLVTVITTGILPFGVTPFRKIFTIEMTHDTIPTASASPATSISVNPASIIDTSKVPGTTFSVDITANDVSDLYSFEFYLRWSGPLLNVTAVTEGPFLKTGGTTYFVKRIWNTPDPKGVSNYAYVSNTLYGVPTGISGSGVLATVTFLVEAVGETTLDLYDTIFLDDFGMSISLTEQDGYFKNGEAPPDFSISASPTSLTIAQGSSGTSTMTLTSLNGFTGAVSLSVSGAPTGVTATLSPASVTLTSGGTSTSTLTIVISASTPTGTSTLTVTGSGGGNTHNVSISLTVTTGPPPATSVSVSPASIIDNTKTPGTTFSVDIAVADVSDLYSFEFRLRWNGPLLNVTAVTEGPFLKTGGPTLFTAKIWNTPDRNDAYVLNTLYGVPTGISGSGVLATVTFLVEAVGETTLDLYDTAFVDSFGEGVYPTEQDGYFKNGEPAAPDFSLSASPATLTIPRGSSDVSTITVTATGGFSSAVALTISGLPTGVTASFDPPSVTPTAGGTATSSLTFTASASATLGTVTVTITGTSTSPALTRTTTISLTVYRELTIKLTGEFDYVRMETVNIRLAALVKDAETMELVSGAMVNVEIYDAAGGLWISEQMLEKIPGSGVYEWMSTGTIAQLRLAKGVYLVRAGASFEGGPPAYDLLMFHIDPPAEGNSESLYYIALIAIAIVGVTVLAFKRRQMTRRRLQKA